MGRRRPGGVVGQRLLALSGTRHCRDSVVAVGVTGMVPCTILLDRDGRPLHWSVQQNDARTTQEVPELRGRLAHARVLERTGSAVTQQSTGPRLLWFAEHDPDVWSKTRWIMGSYDYIAMRLSGARAVESNWALESGLFDLEVHGWAEDIVQAAGARVSLLPPVARPDDVIGHVTPEAARETGLPSESPLWPAVPITSARRSPQDCSQTAIYWSSWAVRETSCSSSMSPW